MKLITEYITEIIGALGMVSAYFVGVKKDKASIFQSMQKSYQTFIDDFNLKYDLMQSQVKSMQKQIDVFQSNEETLRQTIQTLDAKINKLQAENRKLRQRLNKYEQ